jgi:glycosyltransferase involved in cell wall biosynthesis
MNVGGPATLLVDLIDEFDAAGIEHLLVTGRCYSNEIDLLDSRKLHSPHLYLGKLGRKVSLWNDFVSLLKLIKVIRDFDPHVIHTHTSKAGVLGRLASLISRQGARRVHTFHGHLLYGYFRNIVSILVVQIERQLAKITDRLIAVSHVVKNDLLDLKVGEASKWQVIHPGIKLTSMLQHKAEISHNNVIRLLWIGRFTSIKNPLLSLQAFEYIHRELRSTVELTMVGDGELLQECVSWAQLRRLPIKFSGWVKDVFPLISSSHLLLITSKNEGLPVVMLEAASLGVPTLATNVGGISDFIVPNETGFFADDNPTSFGNCLLNILKEPEKITNVGLESNRLVAKSFTTQFSAQKHIELYKELS